MGTPQEVGGGNTGQVLPRLLEQAAASHLTTTSFLGCPLACPPQTTGQDANTYL